MEKNYYLILNVSQRTSAMDIKKAYHQLCRKYHPDANNGSKKQEEQMKFVNEAYEVLSDEIKRKAYDEKLIASETTKLRFGKQQAEMKKAQAFSWVEFFSRAAIFIGIVLLIAAVINGMSKNLKS
ncbi:MAG TPA: DnaJ domain-containing protein [Bacteroidia bacterium]|nr:DnaJ domain-containing protein [Bacteroidia bacterium]